MSDELNSSGINFFQGYEEKNFVEADIYVIGNAISKENTILKEILRLKKKIISGPEWLYENILQKTIWIAYAVVVVDPCFIVATTCLLCRLEFA